MPSKLLIASLLVAGLGLFWPPHFATADEIWPREARSAVPSARFSFGTGYEYTTGKYGGMDSVEETSIPISAKYETNRFVFKMGVPYLRVRAIGQVLIDDSNVICTDRSGSNRGPGGGSGSGSGGGGVEDGCITQTTTTVVTEPVVQSGLGDLTTSLTYQFPQSDEKGMFVDVTGKASFGTGDKDKGLSTGRNSYTFSAELSQSFGDTTLFGGAGYKFRQKPEGSSLRNTASAVLGANLRATDTTSVELIYDFRQASRTGSANSSEVTATLYSKLAKDIKLNMYALKGFTDASPDWGGGLGLSWRF